MVAVLTIGEFARASHLSPKALRLYDELGLLTPARVDPVSGYRLYEPGQLEQARLVAWLRRLGMPLARIRVVCDLPPAAAAAEVAAFWAQAEADLASRRDLAAFLTTYLAAREPVSDGAGRGGAAPRGMGREGNRHDRTRRRSSPSATPPPPTSGAAARSTRTPPTRAADCSRSRTGRAAPGTGPAPPPSTP